MESLRSIEALVALEDDAPEVLFEQSRVAPVHLWPLIRASLALANSNAELNRLELSNLPSSRRQPRFQYHRSLTSELLLPNPRSSAHVPRNIDNLFIVNGTTTHPTAQGQEDWLVGDLASNSPSASAILQDRALPRFPPRSDRPTFAQTFSHKDRALLVGLASRRTRLTDADIKQVRRFIGEVTALIDFPMAPATIARLEAGMLAVSQRLAAYARIYGRLLDRIGPRSVIMANASYMNRTPLLPLLRQRNIPVYEPQHGWIGPSHASYNFGAAFSEPELKAYLPDVLLTFGDFWSDAIHHPSAKVAIGKASLEKAVTRAQEGLTTRDRILLVSSVYRTDELIGFARLVRQRLPRELTVVIRPHPSERPSSETSFAEAIRHDGIELDDETDLYRSLARSRAVVGYSSTVLFEALALRVPTLVLDSPLASLHTPLEVFGHRLSVDTEGADRVVQAAEGKSENESSVDVSRIWRPKAIRNFNAFIDSSKDAGTHNN